MLAASTFKQLRLWFFRRPDGPLGVYCSAAADEDGGFRRPSIREKLKSYILQWDCWSLRRRAIGRRWRADQWTLFQVVNEPLMDFPQHDTDLLHTGFHPTGLRTIDVSKLWSTIAMDAILCCNTKNQVQRICVNRQLTS